MKKLLLSLSLVAGLSYAAQAQGFRFGVKAGASLTNVTGNLGFDYKLGFHGGLQAEYGINATFSIHPELLYSMKGWKYNTFQYDITQQLHYLELPVLARIKAKNVFFEAGPQLGILLAANGIVNGPDPNAVFTIGNNKAYFDTVDFGYVVGLGYQLPAGPGIGLRYNGGLTGIYKDYSGSGNPQNSAFQLYLSYQFGGK